ncbi:hypothetical protein M0802_012883 [Mischocyttarus mexicanus]|nr:hypothetical protein M0802_012883 [Mischocyttarus mexicanus]
MEKKEEEEEKEKKKSMHYEKNTSNLKKVIQDAAGGGGSGGGGRVCFLVEAKDPLAKGSAVKNDVLVRVPAPSLIDKHTTHRLQLLDVEISGTINIGLYNGVRGGGVGGVGGGSGGYLSLESYNTHFTTPRKEALLR